MKLRQQNSIVDVRAVDAKTIEKVSALMGICSGLICSGLAIVAILLKGTHAIITGTTWDNWQKALGSPVAAIPVLALMGYSFGVISAPLWRIIVWKRGGVRMRLRVLEEQTSSQD